MIHQQNIDVIPACMKGYLEIYHISYKKVCNHDDSKCQWKSPEPGQGAVEYLWIKNVGAKIKKTDIQDVM